MSCYVGAIKAPEEEIIGPSSAFYLPAVRRYRSPSALVVLDPAAAHEEAGDVGRELGLAVDGNLGESAEQRGLGHVSFFLVLLITQHKFFVALSRVKTEVVQRTLCHLNTTYILVKKQGLLP